MQSLKRFAPAGLATLFAALIAASSAAAQAQDEQRAARAGAQGAQASNVDLYFPTGEESSSLLRIRAQAPEEVRVGQS